MKNTVLKFSFALGLLTISGSPLSAGPTWEEIQRETNPRVIIQKVENHLSKLEEEKKENPTEYMNAKINFWKARANLVNAYFQPSLRKIEVSEAFADIHDVESTSEKIRTLKTKRLREKIGLIKKKFKEKIELINNQDDGINRIAPPPVNCRQEFAHTLSNNSHKETPPASVSTNCGDY